MTNRLWHAHSKVLDGFYASEVYVSAQTKEEAVQVSLAAYDEWLASKLVDFFYDPLTSTDPGDSEYPFEAAQKRGEFEREITEEIKPLPGNGCILRKT